MAIGGNVFERCTTRIALNRLVAPRKRSADPLFMHFLEESQYVVMRCLHADLNAQAANRSGWLAMQPQARDVGYKTDDCAAASCRTLLQVNLGLHAAYTLSSLMSLSESESAK